MDRRQKKTVGKTERRHTTDTQGDRTPQRKRRRVETPSYIDVDSDSGYETSRAVRRRRKVMKEGGKEKASKTGMNDILEAPTSDFSDTEGVPVNRFIGETIKKRTTYYKSNLETTIKELQSLEFSPHHIKVLKKTPLWILFNSIWTGDRELLSKRCKKNEGAIRKILNCFDDKEEKFVIGGERLKLTARDVSLIFGVVGGTEPIPLKKENYEIVDWVKRCFPKKIETTEKGYNCYKGRILGKLEEILSKQGQEHYEDVARLVMCYLLASLLIPCNNGSINWYITCYVEHLQEIYRYDWSTLVVESLMHQLKRGKSKMVSGCTMILPYWLLEHTSIERPEDEGAVPRYLKWTLPALHRKLEKIDPYLLSRKYVHKILLNPTAREKDIVRKLKDRWDEAYEKWVKDAGVREDGNEALLTDDANETPVHTQSDEEVCATFDLSPVDACTPPMRKKGESRAKRNQTSKRDYIKYQRQATKGKEKNKVQEEGLEDQSKGNSSSHCTKDSGSFSPDFMGSPMNTTVADTPTPDRGHQMQVQIYADPIDEHAHDSVHGVVASAPSFDIGVTPDSFEPQEDTEAAGIITKIAAEYSGAANEEPPEGNGVKSKALEKDEIGRLTEENKVLLQKLGASKMNLLNKEREAALTAQRMEIEANMRFHFQKLLYEERILIRTFYQAKFNTQEEYIGGLLAQMKKMEHQLTLATEDPTTTQIMANPETLERIETIEKLHSTLAEKQLLLDMVRDNASKENGAQDISKEDRLATDILSPPGTNSFAGTNINATAEETIIRAGDTSGKENISDPGRDMDEGGKNQTDQFVTPTSKMQQTKGFGQANSMVKRIKCRTAVGDRKPVPITPEVTTGQLETIDVDDCPSTVVDVIPVLQEFKLDENFPAVRKASQRVKARLKELWSQHGALYEVWRGESALSYVSIADILAVLHSARFSTKVVDCWGDILLESYSHLTEEHPTLNFMSGFWDLITNSTDNDCDLLRSSLDDRLARLVIEKHVLMFPMLTKGEGRHPAGDHWTLLVLDLEKCEWRFYNSLSPRTKCHQDVHLNRSTMLVKYVDNCITKIFQIKYPDHPILQKGIKGPVLFPCPQQRIGSLDCGVVLCNNMEKIVQGKQPKKSLFSEKAAGEYRKRIAEWFVEPVEINVD